MRVSWLVGIALLFLIGTIISVTIQGHYLDSGTSTLFAQVIDPAFLHYTNPLAAVGGFFVYIFTLLKAIWAVLTWDYAFFTGSLQVFRFAGIAVSLALVVNLVLAIRGTGSG